MQVGFFDIENCYARLDKAGDPWLFILHTVDWSGLAALMQTITFDGLHGGKKGGRPPIDGLLIAKILILQAYTNLSDETVEYQINDRMSFKRFLGLDFNQKSPDARTLWLYRERLKHSGLEKKIFAWFLEELDKAGLVASGGQMIDASFVPTHKPTGKHKKQLAEEIPLTKQQVAQIDTEASFTKKYNRNYHGYKNHIQVDVKHTFIRDEELTTAKTHDSQVFEAILDTKNTSSEVYADSAYKSKESEERLKKRGFEPQIIERAYRNKPLTPEQKVANTQKSKVRARVEHVFGHMNTVMGGLIIHTIGLARAKVKNTFKNLAYNIARFAYLKRMKMQGKHA